MPNQAYEKLINILNSNTKALSIQNNDYSSLLDKIGDARFVLMGEATHGTHEFYQARIEITKALIERKGFTAIAIEGDWPDTYGIHRYLQGIGQKDNWQDALMDFKRFPQWMWRNKTVSPFLRWVRDYNDNKMEPEKIGFYGMDLYSLNASMEAVISYLSTVDAEAAKQARLRYACFDHIKADPQAYGYLTSLGVKKSCIKESMEQFLEIQHHAMDYVRRDGKEEYFCATQNARIVKNAEHYYRSMFEDHVSSWNIRDQHMAETINVLVDHLENRLNKPAKIIIWAHNSHVGDARATEMSERGEINIGQLIREQHGNDVFSIGFSTHHGSVTAASNWDEMPECKKINAGLTGSYEALFHQLSYKNFLLDLGGNKELEHILHLPRLQRAIGVIYRPESERQSHYFFTKLPYQFDALIHFDETTAVQPLDMSVTDSR